MQLRFMDPGQLRTQMTLQDQIETPDDRGGFIVTWTDVSLIWATIETVVPRGEAFGGRQFEEASHRVTMRFRGDVKPGQRLVRARTNYRIQLVSDVDGSERYLTCFVVEERP